MARIGRNDPCPCGSGRKYKHCCLNRPGGIPLGWEESWPDPPAEGAAGAPAGAGSRAQRPAAPRAPETPPYAPRPAAPRAPRPEEPERDRWTGLPVDDLFAILEDPFDVPDLVDFPSRFAEEPEAPVLLVFQALADVAEEGRLTTRADGSLTRAAVRALAARLPEVLGEEPGAPGEDAEHEDAFVALTRLAALRAGLLAQEGRRLRLSRSAMRKLEAAGPGAVYAALFRAFVEEVPWSVGDDLPDEPGIEVAWPFTLMLLQRFGAFGLPDVFYATAYLDTFPAEGARAADADREEAAELAAVAYTLRALFGFAAHFGLATLEGPDGSEAAEDAERAIYAVTSLPLLDEVMRLRVPSPDAEAFFEAEGWPGAAAPPREPRHGGVLDELRAAMADREFDTLEELQAFTDAFIGERNRAPLEDFHGLSPEQMGRLFSAPFDAPELLEVPEVLPAEPSAPVLDLFLPLAEALAGDGLRATAKGNLPRAFCRQAAAAYFTEERLFLDAHATVTGHREEDFHDLHHARKLARKAGLIRLYRGRWLLTARARELLERHGAAGVYPLLLRAAAEVSPWPVGVRDELDRLILSAWPFTAWLLTKHGEEPRPSTFYEDAFVRAFPSAVDALMDRHGGWQSDTADDEEIRAMYAYVAGRLFEMTGLRYVAGFLGLARIRTDTSAEREGRAGRAYTVQATPLLRQAIRFKI